MRLSLAAAAWVLCSISCGLAQETPPASQPSTPPASMQQFVASLASAKPGELVQTPFLDTNSLRPMALSIVPQADAPQFLLSDKPEYFRSGDGISMQEEVKPGVVRLYLYHVPEPTGAKKTISAVIENLGTAPMTFRFDRYASPKPSGDYHKIAREALTAFLNKQSAPPALASRIVAPGGRVVIDPQIDASAVTKDILVHVYHEFTIDQPARVTVFQRDPSADSLKVIDSLPKLPRVLAGFHPSGAGRGLFLTSDVDVTTKDATTVDTADGSQVLIVADGTTDPWIEGRDSIDPASPIQNKGNYGVMYRVKLRYKSTDGKRLAVLMSGHRPDNQWCRYTAAVTRVNDGLSPGGIVALPSSAPRFENLPQAVVMQTYPALQSGQLGEIEFTYSPPGACCLPTPILLVPF